MKKVFFIKDNADGECCSFSTHGFTDDELEVIGRFGEVLSEKTDISIRVGTEDEFFDYIHLKHKRLSPTRALSFSRKLHIPL